MPPKGASWWKQFRDEFLLDDRGGYKKYKDPNEWLNLLVALKNSYPSSGLRSDIDDFENTALSLLSCADAPGLFDAMSELIEFEKTSNPDTVLDGDLSELGEYTAKYAIDRYDDYESFFNRFNTSKFNDLPRVLLRAKIEYDSTQNKKGGTHDRQDSE